METVFSALRGANITGTITLWTVLGKLPCPPWGLHRLSGAGQGGAGQGRAGQGGAGRGGVEGGEGLRGEGRRGMTQQFHFLVG